MPEKNSIQNNRLYNPFDEKVKSLPTLSRSILLGLSAFIILASLFTLLIYQRYHLLKEADEKRAYQIVNQAKDKLQEALTHSLSATKTLAFFIDKNGQVNNFDSVAPQILETSADIDAVELVPDGIIKYIYPLKGNEAVIGYNILKDEKRNKEAYKAIEKKEMFFAGPFPLKQGDVGVVGRLPVYRQGKFWGFSAVVIKMSTLYRTAGISTAEKGGYHFQLSKINPDTKQEEFFLPRLNNLAKTQTASVEVPNGEWRLSVTISNVHKSMGYIGLLIFLGFIFSMIGAVFVYRFAERPKKLNELVLNRTRELRISENNYKSLIERVSDAFISLNKNWEYTYVNTKAGELFGRDQQSLVGKNIWQEFPGSIDQAFYHAYQMAMETQEYQYLEEYYGHLDKWFENHIYPSPDGLTVFYKDVTAVKQIALALKENEEKYRSLIEQASDGIVITDLEGKILEVNNSISVISGYNNEELLGKNLYKFIPQEDVELNPLRFSELMKGNTLLYERRLLKKDGSVLDIEVNSKMASSHALIGFVRDITERKKNENRLTYQARLLEGVSDAITSLDTERQVVSWNKACEELYGFKKTEIMGKRIPELLTFEYPYTTTQAVFKQVYSEGEWKGEFNFIHPKTKRKMHLLSSINLLKNTKDEISGFIITSRDITDKENAAEALQKSNERFELLAEATNDAIWDHDLNKNMTWGNKNLYTLYGLNPQTDTINFEMFINCIHPEEQQGMKERLNIAIQKKQSFIAETFRFKAADGRYKNFYDRAYIKYDEAGNPVRILGAMQDITESEIAQKAILESEEKFRIIIEQASDGIFIADTDTYFVDVNTAGCRMTGYTLAELQKIRFTDIIPPEDLITNPVTITKVQTGSSIINERRLLRKDGSIIDVEISAKRLADGRYQSFARDITERKKAAEKLQQSEQKYKLLFYNNPLPMWMATIPELDIIDVNEAAIKQYGYTKDEFLKLNARDMRPAEDIEHFENEVKKMIPGINNIRSWRHKKKNGTIVHVEIYSHEIMYEGKRVWLGLSHDVTEKFLAKELLQKSYEDIRQLAFNLQSIREDERTNIAREIHDELGQQLTGLKMDLHWLTRKINSNDNEVNDKMKESINLINATITSVRKIATDLRPSILDDLGLQAALEWQGEEFEKRSGTKVDFINNAGEVAVQPKVATGIFRIYQELLTNIARHANADLVKAVLDIDDNRLFFTINDNGIGFDIETIKNKKTLGLLGIKERTLLLGGTYEFKSKRGEGSITAISIPLITDTTAT